MTIVSGTQNIQLKGNTQDYKIKSQKNVVTIAYLEDESIPGLQFIIAYKRGGYFMYQ